VEHWAVKETAALARAVLGAGHTFFVKRVLQRLERGEIGIMVAINPLKNQHLTPVTEISATEP
jgi:hypothetical protein